MLLLAAARALIARGEADGAAGTALSAGRPSPSSTPIGRTHWSIENQPHWAFDTDFDEDAARSCKDHAPQDITLVRKITRNLLRISSGKGSIKRKVKRAGWDDAFLLSLSAHTR